MQYASPVKMQSARRNLFDWARSFGACPVARRVNQELKISKRAWATVQSAALGAYKIIILQRNMRGQSGRADCKWQAVIIWI